jgi:hypothetical protein
MGPGATLSGKVYPRMYLKDVTGHMGDGEPFHYDLYQIFRLLNAAYLETVSAGGRNAAAH